MAGSGSVAFSHHFRRIAGNRPRFLETRASIVATSQPSQSRTQLDREAHSVIQEPIQPTPSPGAGSPWRRSSAFKVALLVAAGVLLAIPLAVAFASNVTPVTLPLAVGASPVPGASAKPDRSDNGKAHGPKAANQGRGPKNGPGKGPITIRAISGSYLSLATDDGWTRTITATSDTVITRGGATIGVGDLKVGDEVRFKQTRNADGSYTINAIEVPTPKAAGEVTAVDGNKITVKLRDGVTRVITVTDATVYELGPGAGSKADVKVGTKIEVQGTVSGDTFTATAVEIELPHAGGLVTAKTDDSITVQEGDGTTIVIHVSGSTTYKGKGNAASSLADIAVGARVRADGTLRADGSLDAVAIHAGPAKGPKPEKAPKAPRPLSSAGPETPGS
jgi:hypothetical protein